MAVDQGYNLRESNEPRCYKDLPSLPKSYEDDYHNPELVSRFSESPKSRPESRRSNYGSRRLKAKSSLLNLFNRAKSHTRRDEDGDDPVASSLLKPHSMSTGLISIARATTPTGAELHPLYRRLSTRSIRQDAQSIRHRPSTAELPDRLSEERDETTLPSLLDVYSDSAKVSMAQALEDIPSHRLMRPRKSNASHIVPARASEERRESVDSTRDGRAPSRHSRISIAVDPYPNKIFALRNNGTILQYTENGGGERLPEKILQLNPESAAFASDLVPGRLYVLQVEHKHSSAMETPHHTHNVLTKIHSKNNAARLNESNMVLILDTAEELASWIGAVRKQIKLLSGIRPYDDDPFSVRPVSPAVPKLRVRKSTIQAPPFTDVYTPSMGIDAQRRPSTSASRTASVSANSSNNRPGTANNRSRSNSQATSAWKSSSPERKGSTYGNHTLGKSSVTSVQDVADASVRTPHKLGRDSLVENSRPDSYVPDLPNIWSLRRRSTDRALSASPKESSNALGTDAEPQFMRSNTTASPSSRSRHTPTPLRSSQATIDQGNNIPAALPPTPSIRISTSALTDFVLPPPPPPPPPSTVPSPPTTSHSRDRSGSVGRSVRYSTSAVRPNKPNSLAKAGSTPNLRAASVFYQSADMSGSFFAPLPIPDLGMPVVGLGPPAPPPRAPLPAIPRGVLQRKLSAV